LHHAGRTAHEATSRVREAGLSEPADGPALAAARARRRSRARGSNEREKLFATALDRISTLVIAEAAVAPLFQDQGLTAGHA
jgi:hypothetical protein